METRKRWVGLVAVVIAALLAGCALSASGVTFRGNLGVADALEAGRPLPGYTYYYSGPEDYPLAILGVRSEFHLRQDFWIPVELTPARLRGWMEVINNQSRDPRSRYQGSVISTADGQEIGIWYSPLDWSTVWLGAGNEVAIATPSNTLYDVISSERPLSPATRGWTR